ncbi:MAG: DUF3078 domain-containing protein [Paludibacteraceae bacterium]|nr:DUF3078 domain-containing protein [Paludibacteraceae bacterium]
MKGKRIILLLLAALLVWPARGQEVVTESKDKAWKFDGIIGLNANGTGLVNWTGGGKNSASGLAFAKLHLSYYKDALAWETNLDTDFGLSWEQKKEDPWKKSSDKIKLSSKFGWEFQPTWFLTVRGSFESQYAVGRKMRDGYDPPISKFLAPSYTDLSVGFDWKTNVNGCKFSLYMSPLAMLVVTAYVSDWMNNAYNKEHKELVPGDDNWDFRREMQMKYGTFRVIKDAAGKIDIDWRNARVEVGMGIQGSISYRYDNMTLLSTLTLFTPYQGRGFEIKEAYETTYPGEKWTLPLRYSNLNRQFGYFDANWETTLTYQFAKVLNVTLSTNLKYLNGTLIADDEGVWAERVQFKMNVGIGLGYSF